MPKLVKAGLLPLYLALYDRVRPEVRDEFAPFLAEIARRFEKQGVHIVRESICCVKEEVEAAVARIEQQEVDLLITLHLAYSPSLESIEALERTRLPLLLLDTTMDAGFGFDTNPDRVIYNHGIHGVQDLSSVLLRRGRPYRVAAGHLDHSDVIKRAAGHARAAAAARALQTMKVLRIGPSFTGMGDFHVEEKVLRRQLGVEVVQHDTRPLVSAAAALREEEIQQEMQADRDRYVIEVSEDTHRRSVQAALALQRATEAEGCGACSFNFLAFESGEGPLSTVPFMGASRMMAAGFGYAGEGDVLTAALVGALSQGFLVNFTEMFCPDWKEGTVFLSHMGEFNPACAGGAVHMVEKPFPWSAAHNPAIMVGPMKPGAAILVNIAPGPSDSFRLIAAPVEVLGDTNDEAMRQTVRGWFRPGGDLAAFLEWYSIHGGTHHCALLHDASLESVKAFAAYAGLQCVTPDGYMS